MNRYKKIREDILSGKSDNNISEEDMKFFCQKSEQYTEGQLALIFNIV